MKPLTGIAIIIFCVVMYAIFQTPSGRTRIHEREEARLKAENRKLQRSLDSLQVEYNNTLIHYALLKKKSDEAAKQTAIQIIEHEKIIYRNYTDPQRDSILSTLYPSYRNR